MRMPAIVAPNRGATPGKACGILNSSSVAEQTSPYILVRKNACGASALAPTL